MVARHTFCPPRIGPCQSQHRRTARAAAGFSLIELLVTIAIVAILVGVALPSFRDTITRNRIAGATNDFIAGLNYARTEALRRNGSAGLCPTDDGLQCGKGWAKKWMVFQGDPTDPTVLRQGEFSPQDDFSADSAAAITFDGRGMLGGSNVVFKLKPDQCEAGKPMLRVFNVHRTGNVSVSKGNCA